MKHFLALLLSFLFFHFSFSQNERTIIYGKIAHQDLPISNVHIHNLNSNYGEITTNKGNFEILVKKSDTLKISHLEYQSKKIIISNDHIKKGVLTIDLKLMTNYLNTVTIKKHNLSGNLFTDALNFTNDSINKKYNFVENLIAISKESPQNGNYKNEINFEKPIMNDVNPIKISGGGSFGISIKDHENILRRRLRSKKSFPVKLVFELGEDFFINELKISKDKIHHFISYCEFRNIITLYNQNKILKIIEILTEESLDFNNIKN